MCKAGISKEKIIPVYGKGKQRRGDENSLPSRPAPERAEAPSQQEGGGPWNALNIQFGLGFGFFPATMIGLWANHATARMPDSPTRRLLTMVSNTLVVIFAVWILLG